MPSPPKSYGAPLGPQAQVPRSGRPQVGAADPATIHAKLDAYEKHILAEHQKIQQARQRVPRPPAAPAANANSRGGLNLRVEKALKDAGA